MFACQKLWPVLPLAVTLPTIVAKCLEALGRIGQKTKTLAMSFWLPVCVVDVSNMFIVFLPLPKHELGWLDFFPARRPVGLLQPLLHTADGGAGGKRRSWLGEREGMDQEEVAARRERA